MLANYTFKGGIPKNLEIQEYQPYHAPLKETTLKLLYVILEPMLVLCLCLYIVDLIWISWHLLKYHCKWLINQWYVHFASCFYIDIHCIMGCYYTLCHNTYAYSLLFYKVYIKRENAGSWDSGLENEQILETYSAQLQKSWNFTEDVFQIYKKY